MEVEEIKQRSVKGIISYNLRHAYNLTLAAVANLLLSLYLSPEEFGIYFIVLAVVGLFSFLSDIGLASALIQKKQEPTLKELRTTFTVQQSLAFLIFFLIIILTPVWRDFAGIGSEGLMLLYMLGLSFPLVSLKTIPSILLERKLNFQKLVIPSMVEQTLFYAVAIYLAANGYGIQSFTAAVILRSLSGIVVIYLIQPWPIGLAFSKPALKGLISFGIKFQLYDFLARVKDDLYIIVLARFIPANQMGFIGWSKRWSLIPYQFAVHNLVAITFPTYSRLQDNLPLLKRAIEKSLYFIALFIFPVLLGMGIMAGPLTTVIEGYRKWQPALPALYFFLLNIAFASIANPLLITLNALGKINRSLKLMIFMTLLTWGLTPFLLSQYGYTGIAIASVFVAASSLWAIVMLRPLVPVSIIPAIASPLLSSILMGLVLIYTYNFWSLSIWHLLFGVISGFGLYLTAILLTGRRQFILELKSLPFFRT